VDLTIYDGKLVGCYNPPLLKEGDGAPEAMPPCLRLPIRCSSSESMSTLNMIASSEIGHLGIKACFSLLSMGGTFLPRGDLKGECACLSGCTFLLNIVILRADDTLGAFCLTTSKSLTLNVL
jgi:hypothetical protein